MTQFIELNRFCAFEDKTFGVLHIPQIGRRYLTVERMFWGSTFEQRDKNRAKKASGYELARHCLVPKIYNLGCLMREDLTFKVLIKGMGYVKKASFETGRNPYVWPPGSIMLFNDGQSFLDREIDSDALNDFDDYFGNLYTYGQFSGNNRVALMIQDDYYIEELTSATSLEQRLLEGIEKHRKMLLDPM